MTTEELSKLNTKLEEEIFNELIKRMATLFSHVSNLEKRLSAQEKEILVLRRALQGSDLCK